VVHPEPHRALFFSASKGANAATGVSPDGPIPHGILGPDPCAFFSLKPIVSHYGEGSKTRHGQDPSHSEPSFPRSDGAISLPFRGHPRVGNVIAECGGRGDVP